MELWSIIVKSNTFNFLIMVALLGYIVKKFKLVQKLDEAVLKVKQTIDSSENKKKESVEELEKVKEQTKNVADEIKEIEKKATENVFNSSKKIGLETEKQINSIKNSAQKIIDAKEKEIVSNLSKKTVLASFDLACKHIINLLKQNPQYHQKFIDESIEELNRLKQ